MKWAHSLNVQGNRQRLRDHLLGTASLAREFGTEFGAGEAAYVIGLLHDAGKIAAEWQQRLLALESGRPAASVDHKRLGALLSKQATRSPGVFAIQGHHGGLPNAPDCPTGTPDSRLVDELVAEVPEIVEVLAHGHCVPTHWSTLEMVEFGTRMLHSALVDADYLDTAAHFAGGEPVVLPHADFANLADRFERSRAAELDQRPPSRLDADRQALYDAAVAAAQFRRGLYRMSAPTGSGKTLAAAGFGLHHAAIHGLRRVIVAVPFTTITEQNAAVYRRMLGDEIVLEHHSAVEPQDMARYGVENWDSAFVVTTTVQLFESIFSNKPSKTRKLHRLCNSVIVLDEVQALPKDLLNPILDALRLLTSQFGATVLLASATQPAFESLTVWKQLGLSPVEIVSDPDSLYRRLARVAYEWRPDISAAELQTEIADQHSALVVMNTTVGSREMANELAARMESDSVLHLSTRMCRAHRGAVLKQARERLQGGRRVHLISTQLIEAGVDIDLPVVFRQEAPAESLIQAAGRANREGRLEAGRVVVFSGQDFRQLRQYLTGVGLTNQHFAANPNSLNSPSCLYRYFAELFSLLNIDASGRPVQRPRADLAFKTVAENFRMIDSATVSVLVDWDGAHARFDASLSSSMRAGREPIPMLLLRAAQPYAVDLPARLAETEYAKFIHEAVRGLFVWAGPYSALTGIGGSEPSTFIF